MTNKNTMTFSPKGMMPLRVALFVDIRVRASNGPLHSVSAEAVSGAGPVYPSSHPSRSADCPTVGSSPHDQYAGAPVWDAPSA
ncbi:hypothetical protein ACOMHN_056904 [Nucella lapillus]